MGSGIFVFSFLSFGEKMMPNGISGSNKDCAGMIGVGDKDDNLFAAANVCGA
jgi:hypothetical protein